MAGADGFAEDGDGAFEPRLRAVGPTRREETRSQASQRLAHLGVGRSVGPFLKRERPSEERDRLVDVSEIVSDGCEAGKIGRDFEMVRPELRLANPKRTFELLLGRAVLTHPLVEETQVRDVDGDIGVIGALRRFDRADGLLVEGSRVGESPELEVHVGEPGEALCDLLVGWREHASPNV
jgi:hypothetical protein